MNYNEPDTWTFLNGDILHLCGSFNGNDVQSNGKENVSTDGKPLWPEDERIFRIN